VCAPTLDDGNLAVGRPGRGVPSLSCYGCAVFRSALRVARLALVGSVLVASGCCRDRAVSREPSPALSASAPLSPASSANLAAGSFFGQDTFAVIAGVLRFADPSVTAFSAHHRKDQELYDQLLERGVPKDHIALLLDEALRAQAFREALERLARAAPEGSTLIVYYAGHGARAQYDGSTSFLAYDTGQEGGEAIQVDEIAVTILHAFRGARVLMMADCCYSGALQNAAQQLRDRGIAAVTMTSADASNASTQNWTFTQTVIDAIRGEPLLDSNGDGVIVLQELASEVADAMKYRERQRAGYSCYGVPGDTVMARTQGRRPEAGAAPEPYRPGRYLEASDGVGWQPVRILSTTGAQSVVRFYHYSDAMDVPTPHRELRPIRFQRYPAGAALRVEWEKKTWDAKVLEVDGDFHKITYPGWPAYWNEWILSDRIVSSRATKVR